MTTFSVIVPSFNRRQFLLPCLESIRVQRHRAEEVIVVDDGSTDGSREMLSGLDDVKTIHQANAGAGAARNTGAAEARGDYLAFLDSDDLWFPWSLEVMASAIAEHGDPALLFAAFSDFRNEVPLPQIARRPARFESFPCFIAAADRGFFAGAGMMVIRRDAFVEAGGFIEDNLNAEDHDLALRLATAPGFVRIASPLIGARRLHASNETNDLAKCASGLLRLIGQERGGAYPGGAHYARDRRQVIARHARPVVLALAAAGRIGAALRLYWRSLPWNLSDGRLRFLLGAPALVLLSWLRAKP